MTDSADVRVHSLACARAEDAMSEGMLEGFALEHVSECSNCRELAELLELTGDTPGLVAATMPAPLPEGFVDRVLDRAFEATHPLDRIRPATDDLRVAELEAALADRRSRTRWIALAALAAGLLLAVGVSSLIAPSPGPSSTPEMQPVAKATDNPQAAPASLVSPPVTSTERAAVSPPAPSESRPAAKATPPVAPDTVAAPPQKLEAVPEPMLDIPAEIRGLLVQKIRSHRQCPKRNGVPVRVTLTVGEDGKVSSPQVLSSSGHAAAHQCVSYALDRLLLPPLKGAVTVTLDLTW